MDEEILAEMNKIIKEFDCAKKMKTGIYTPKNLKKEGHLTSLPAFLNQQNEKKFRFFISFKIDFENKKSPYITLKNIEINETLGESYMFLPRMKEFFYNRLNETIYFGKGIAVRPEDKFDEYSLEFFEILKSIMQEESENIIRRGNIRVPYFLLGGILPLCEKMCLNYLKKDIYPEIELKRTEKDIIIHTDKLKNWYPFGRNYMIYEDEDKDYKIIRSDYDISPIFILKELAKKEKIKVSRLNFDSRKFIEVFEKIIKIVGIEEMKSTLYHPKTIEAGIVFDIVDDMLTAVSEGIFDGKRKQDMEEDIFVDGAEVKRVISEAEDMLIQKGFSYDNENNRFYMTSENKIFDFIIKYIKNYSEDFSNIYIFSTPEFDKKNLLKGNIRLTFSKKKDFVFNFESDVFSKSQISEIILFKTPLKKYYRLKNGDILKVEDTNLTKMYEMLYNISVSDSEIISGKFRRSRYFDFFLNKYNITENNCMDYFIFIPEIKIPMKEHQKFGVNWMMSLKDKNMGGIVADDMGLGKILQALIYLRIQQKIYPQAIQMAVVPKVVLCKWENRIKKYFKNMKYRIIEGESYEREEKILNISPGELVFTTHSLLVKDIHLYEKFEFSSLILDEAQAIKNAKTLMFKAVNTLKKDSCFVLTEVPIEKNPMELWSVFETILPGYLGEISLFKQKYILETNNKVLLSFIKPYILKSTKEKVEKAVLQKAEKKIILELEPRQKEIYEKFLAEYSRQIFEDENIKTIQILKLATRLRKICTYPEIGNGDYYEVGAKEQELNKLLETLVEKKSKIIIFSQFISGLKKLEEKYSKIYKTLYLDGNTATKKRIKLIEEFNQDGKEILFISLKAGEVGFNVIGADVIIYYDFWWDPVTESQIQDKVHKIGRRKEVLVYSFVTKSTIEEYIYGMKDEKRDSNRDGFDNYAFELSREELIHFFQKNRL